MAEGHRRNEHRYMAAEADKEGGTFPRGRKNCPRVLSARPRAGDGDGGGETWEMAELKRENAALAAKLSHAERRAKEAEDADRARLSERRARLHSRGERAKERIAAAEEEQRSMAAEVRRLNGLQQRLRAHTETAKGARPAVAARRQPASSTANDRDAFEARRRRKTARSTPAAGAPRCVDCAAVAAASQRPQPPSTYA